MKVTHAANASGGGPLTVGKLADYVASLNVNGVPSEAEVEVKHSFGQRDEPSWSIQTTWTGDGTL